MAKQKRPSNQSARSGQTGAHHSTGASSSNQYDIPAPCASQVAFCKYQSVINPGLVFTRFAPDWRHDSTCKKIGLERVIAQELPSDLLRASFQRWEKCVQAANATVFTMRTDWRFVAGLGRKGPLEVGFTFNRYGIPILPGSSVKGITRATALLLEGIAEQSAEFVAIFGRAPETGSDETVAQTGGAIFFDAIPTKTPSLELDVMNPHFPDYYKGAAPPTNWQSPIPVYFLTVAPGTEFAFAVGWRGAQADVALRDKAVQWLKRGLTELGAGAKTNAGYGYFVDEGASASPTPALQTQPASMSATPAEPPQGELRRSEGRLIREQHRREQRIFVQDGNLRLPVLQERLGKQDYNSLPGNKQPVSYEYDEVDGERRVWKVRRKS